MGASAVWLPALASVGVGMRFMTNGMEGLCPAQLGGVVSPEDMSGVVFGARPGLR